LLSYCHTPLPWYKTLCVVESANKEPINLPPIKLQQPNGTPDEDNTTKSLVVLKQWLFASGVAFVIVGGKKKKLLLVLTGSPSIIPAQLQLMRVIV